jgi:hypothetical protein
MMEKCEKTEEPSREWLLEQIEDEHKAHKMYCKYGFPDIARDEARHEIMLREKLIGGG